MRSLPKFNVDVKLGLKLCNTLIKDKIDSTFLFLSSSSPSKNYFNVLKRLIKEKDYYCETENVLTVNQSKMNLCLSKYIN